MICKVWIRKYRRIKKLYPWIIANDLLEILFKFRFKIPSDEGKKTALVEIVYM